MKKSLSFYVYGLIQSERLFWWNLYRWLPSETLVSTSASRNKTGIFIFLETICLLKKCKGKQERSINPNSNKWCGSSEKDPQIWFGSGGERITHFSNLAPCLASFSNQTRLRVGLQTEALLFQAISHKHHLLLGR